MTNLSAEQLKEAAFKAEFEEKDAQIAALQEQLAQKSNPSTDLCDETATVKGKDVVEGDYKIVVVAFYFEGKDYTASEAIKDNDLMYRLVKEDIGFIKKVR